MEFVEVEYKPPNWVKTKESSLVIIPGWGSSYMSDLWVTRAYDGRPWICGKVNEMGDTFNTSLKCVRDSEVRERLLKLLKESEQ